MVNIALRAARVAGRIILHSMDRVDALDVREKGPNDLVSEIDLQAEEAIIETIAKSYPDHAVHAEESGASEAAADAEYTWVIDPLDGTTNFLHGIPHFCTSIAVTRGPVLEHGVVVDHVRNEQFTASRGAGAYVNGRRMRVSRHLRLDDSIMAGGLPFPAVDAHLDAYAAILKDFMSRCRTIRRQGAAALDLAYLADGRVDGFFELGLKPWDMAAGVVIAREAGGFVADAAGGERFLTTGNVVAANPRLFRELLRLIRAHAAESGDAVLANG
jgi:myo-inositol-1(or 4)-monophosphatase